MTNSKRNQVFISYSHQDILWLKRLQVHLKPLERQGLVKVWDDTRISPGSKWRDEIKKAIASAKVIILIISPDFLASDFIASDEIPPLLKAADDEGAVVLPLLVKFSLFLQTPALSQFQSVGDPKRPLSSLSESEQDQALLDVALAVRKEFSNPQ